MTPCEIWPLGRVPYAEALVLQERLVAERAAGAPDRLLLLEHPPVYTLGSAADASNILWSAAERAQHGIEVVAIDRGGDVTYHGPGQLVAYPILQLPRMPGAMHANVVGYVRALERTIVAALATYGIEADTIKGLTGVWVRTAVGDAKIAAIGVRVNVKAITKHGLALNLNTDLSHFDGIIPCGIRDKGVTSLAALLGGPVDEADARRRFAEAFGSVFEREMTWVEES
jgi:lipoyl(octanoyl) transferase